MTARVRPSLELDSPWLIPAEAAAYARTDLDSVYEALHNGELVGHRRGGRGRWRIHSDALDAWIRGELGAAS